MGIEGSGAMYKARTYKRVKKASSTPGSEKHPCIPGYLDKYFAKNSRSYKHSGYGAWCKRMDEKNPRPRN